MRVGDITATHEGRRLYWIWAAMVQRCHNPSNKWFVNYGARGILVCDAWRASFLKFADDIGPRPEGYVLDRIDNSRGYSKDNCRWVDSHVSNSNRRSVTIVTVGDESMTLKEACRRAGLSYRATLKRLERGWSMEDAMTAPHRSRLILTRVMYRGRLVSIAEVASELGLTTGAARERLRRGRLEGAVRV